MNDKTEQRWLRIAPDFMESDLITEMRRQVNGDWLVCTYLKMLENSNGWYRDRVVPGVSLSEHFLPFSQGLAASLNEPEHVVRDLLRYLVKQGRVRETEQGLDFSGIVPDEATYIEKN